VSETFDSLILSTDSTLYWAFWRTSLNVWDKISKMKWLQYENYLFLKFSPIYLIESVANSSHVQIFSRKKSNKIFDVVFGDLKEAI
jgi:hypothetical protein